MLSNNSEVKRKVLVIGGSGFLGSHVADALSDGGYDVHILDCSHSLWLRKDQKMIIGDILDHEFVDQAVSNCYAVYNFAAISDLNEAINRPIDTIKINILGNANILEACVNHKVKRFIYASTVYVNSREGGFYRCSKQASEQYIEEYSKKYGLEYTVLRYGSLYGPRSDKHNGLWRIVKKALDTGKVSYQGNVESMREYIHIEDAARASVVALSDDFCNQHVVLTGQEPMRVLDLLKMLSEILGIDDAVEFTQTEYAGHYIRTPYAYQPRLGRKYVPPMHVDLGQGLLQLINELKVDIYKVL
jgi:UDP-glucose 4-epimerase